MIYCALKIHWMQYERGSTNNKFKKLTNWEECYEFYMVLIDLDEKRHSLLDQQFLHVFFHLNSIGYHCFTSSK